MFVLACVVSRGAARHLLKGGTVAVCVSSNVQLRLGPSKGHNESLAAAMSVLTDTECRCEYRADSSIFEWSMFMYTYICS